MTGLVPGKGGNFKARKRTPELADLPGFLDHLGSIRLALLAVGMKRGPGKAEQGNRQNERIQRA
jgi:hypothetical protein